VADVAKSLEDFLGVKIREIVESERNKAQKIENGGKSDVEYDCDMQSDNFDFGDSVSQCGSVRTHAQSNTPQAKLDCDQITTVDNLDQINILIEANMQKQVDI